MKFNKHTEPLAPYVASASRLVALKRVKSIRGYKARKTGLVRTLGCCHYRTRHSFNITILSHVYIEESIKNNKITRGKLVPRRLEDLLTTLAHELAHVEFIEHSPAHLWLMSKILQNMAKTAFKLGIEYTQTQDPVPLPRPKGAGK